MKTIVGFVVAQQGCAASRIDFESVGNARRIPPALTFGLNRRNSIQPETRSRSVPGFESSSFLDNHARHRHDEEERHVRAAFDPQMNVRVMRQLRFARIIYASTSRRRMPALRTPATTDG